MSYRTREFIIVNNLLRKEVRSHIVTKLYKNALSDYENDYFVKNSKQPSQALIDNFNECVRKKINYEADEIIDEITSKILKEFGLMHYLKRYACFDALFLSILYPLFRFAHISYSKINGNSSALDSIGQSDMITSIICIFIVFIVITANITMKLSGK